MAKAQILIIGDIGPGWWDMIDSKSISDQLILLNDAEEIEVLINSPGGFVDEGLSIFNVLIEAGKTQKIITKNIGQCCSIASLIFLAGNERVMMPGTKLMVHQASSGEWGKADDLRKKADELEDESNNIFNLMIARSDKLKENENKIREYFDEEKFIFADECVELGFAHKVEELPKAFKFSNNKMVSLMSDLKKTNLTLMQKLERFLSGKKMQSYQTDGDNAQTIHADGELKEGTAVYSDEDMTVPLPDGDIVIGGSTYTVKDGKITSVSVTSDTSDADDAAATAAAATAITDSMKSFPNGDYMVNNKNYTVKDGVVSLKIESVVDVKKDPQFMQMKKDLDLLKSAQAKAENEKKQLESENKSMKELIKEVSETGIGMGLGNLDKSTPAGFEMKDGKLVKKETMSRKERLLMVAEQMESVREKNG